MSVSILEFGSEVSAAVKETLIKFKGIVDRIDFDAIEITNSADAYKIAASMSNLSKALVEMSRENRERSALLDEACDILKGEIKQLLGKNPDLTAQCLAVIHEATEAQKAKLEKPNSVRNLPEINEGTIATQARIKNVRPKAKAIAQ